MKKLLYIFTALAFLCSCSDRVDIIFDTPFVSVSDETELNTSMVIDKDANNLLTTLIIRLTVSNNYFKDAISVEYELIAGNGLTEGVDFKVQPSTKSPLLFEKGTYTMPVRIIWMKNPDFDPEKDNTLTLKLCGSNIPEMVYGYPGPNALRSSFVFTKK